MKNVGKYLCLGTMVASAVACSAADEVTKAQEALCCSDFEVGADMTGAEFGVDAELQGKFEIFAQAIGDLSATASASLADVEIACSNIARDLGTSTEDISKAKDTEAVCGLAANAIAEFNATIEGSASIDLQYSPPSCSASISAKADCQAKCEGKAECNIEANPPTCEGGKLEIECHGECTAEAGASISCEGSCGGSCSGSCTANAGATVQCDGKCEGTCSAGTGADETGIQADGTCKGQCEGTCEMSAEANIECSGSCKGQCEGSCTAEAGASVKCDGSCDADYEPLKCSGGELKGGCKAEASCEANCDASVKAKAECNPPSVKIAVSATGEISAELQAQINAAVSSLEVNLPNLLIVAEARGKAFVTSLRASVEAGAKIATSGDLSAEAVACGVKITAAGSQAVANMGAAVDASLKVVGEL